jgi:hypothetical protein
MVTLTRAQIDALCAAATDGIRFDGLRVRREDDGYRFEAGGSVAKGLSEADLRCRAEGHAAAVANWHFWERTVEASPAGRAFLRWLERAAMDTDREEHAGTQAGTAGETDSPAEAQDDTDPHVSGGPDDPAMADGTATVVWSVPERHDRLRDGLEREWGQLRIMVTLGDHGRRRYRLHHVDDCPDECTDGDELASIQTVRDLADRTTIDDRGRYRPLKTAPTLPTGWRFDDLEWSTLLAALGEVYPATIENWHRERQGTLDIEHYRGTASRQTGIYDVVDDLPREALEWVAEACCVDSQCLKRREWDAAPGDELDVPRGEGAFPCREPCSLLIAAARKWTRLEDENTRTYEFELTPSEKAQIDAVVSAVAEGRTDEIREADLGDPANRYRIRYLRAKRFADEGFPE